MTVTAGATTTVNVNMPVAPLEMAPPVAVGYGELERSEVTGVVTEVPSEAFNTGQIVTSEELIKGKVAGVQVKAVQQVSATKDQGVRWPPVGKRRTETR